LAPIFIPISDATQISNRLSSGEAKNIPEIFTFLAFPARGASRQEAIPIDLGASPKRGILLKAAADSFG